VQPPSNILNLRELSANKNSMIKFIKEECHSTFSFALCNFQS